VGRGRELEHIPIERRWLAIGATALKPATLQAMKVPVRPETNAKMAPIRVFVMGVAVAL